MLRAVSQAATAAARSSRSGMRRFRHRRASIDNSSSTTFSVATIEAVVVERPEPEEEYPQHLCLDKGFDTPAAEQAVRDAGYEPHIRRIGEETKPCDASRGHKPRRWVVERTIGWLNRCRAILVRWDKKAKNYLGLLKLACILLWFRRYHRLASWR